MGALINADQRVEKRRAYHRKYQAKYRKKEGMKERYRKWSKAYQALPAVKARAKMRRTARDYLVNASLAALRGGIPVTTALQEMSPPPAIIEIIEKWKARRDF